MQPTRRTRSKSAQTVFRTQARGTKNKLGGKATDAEGAGTEMPKASRGTGMRRGFPYGMVY